MKEITASPKHEQSGLIPNIIVGNGDAPRVPTEWPVHQNEENYHDSETNSLVPDTSSARLGEAGSLPKDSVDETRVQSPESDSRELVTTISAALTDPQPATLGVLAQRVVNPPGE